MREVTAGRYKDAIRSAATSRPSGSRLPSPAAAGSCAVRAGRSTQSAGRSSIKRTYRPPPPVGPQLSTGVPRVAVQGSTVGLGGCRGYEPVAAGASTPDRVSPSSQPVDAGAVSLPAGSDHAVQTTEGQTAALDKATLLGWPNQSVGSREIRKPSGSITAAQRRAPPLGRAARPRPRDRACPGLAPRPSSAPRRRAPWMPPRRA